jgi:hypothetical protein
MTNKDQAFKTLNTFATARVQLIEGMRKAGYTTLEECRPIVIEWACTKTGAQFNTAKSGKVMLDSKDANYESTKTVVRDVMLMLAGTTRREAHAKGEPADAVAQLVAKFAKLSKAEQKRFARLAGL